MNKMKNKLKIKNGFSLIEMLLVLGVLAVLLIAAFVVYPKVRANVIAEKEVKNIAMIQAGISNLYKGQSSFQSLNNTLLVNAKIVPESMISRTTNPPGIVNESGGTVTVAGVPEYNYSQYWITYTQVPSEVCQKLAEGLVASSEALNVGGIQVKYHTDPQENWKANESRVENIGQGCNTSSNVTIIAQYAQ